MKKTVVAIFEDDIVNRFLYERLFTQRKDDIELYVFDNPEAGIEMAKTVNFDVVFIEIHFWEDFGGISILQKLKKVAPPQMISIAMTSLLQKGDLEFILASGFTLCFEKPVVFTEADLYKFI